MNNEEKRKFPRISDFLHIRYEIIKPQNGSYGSSSENLSEGGVCVPTDQNLQPGMILKLQIHFPNDPTPVVIIGEVAWIRDFEGGQRHKQGEYRFLMGIQYQYVAPQDYQKMMKHIKTKLPKS